MIGLCAVGVLAWLAIALSVMPQMIAAAYEGHGFGPLMRAMSHRHEYGLDHYQAQFLSLAIIVLAIWILGLLGPATTTSRWFERRIIGRATPGTLGAMRMFVAIIAISSALHDSTLNTLKLVTIVLLSLTTIGLLTRPAIVLATICYLQLPEIQKQLFWFDHTSLILCYVLLVLCFVRCGDGFSLDRIINIWRHKPIVDPDEATRYYGWARWFVWLAICMPFVMAGLSKLTISAHGWAFGSPGRSTRFFTFAGIATITAEIGMILCLVSRRARWILPPITLIFHYGIQRSVSIPLYNMILMQALLWDWRAIRIWLAGKLYRYRSHWILLYDGQCRLCRRAVGILSGIDLLKRIQFINFRTVDFDRFNCDHNVRVTRDRAESEMILVGQGKVWGGYDAYQQMTLMVPLLMPIAPLMCLPGISHAGRKIYWWVARNRLNFFQCHDRCELSSEVPSSVECEGPGRRFVVASVLAFAIPLMVLVGWFLISVRAVWE